MGVTIDFKKEDMLQTIKYKGQIDWDKLYKTMTGWLFARQYNFDEKVFKFKPPEFELEWSAWKNETEFIKYRINVTFHFWDWKEIEIEENGKKKKVVDARVAIEIWGELEIDYQGRWEGSNWLDKTRDFFIKYIMRKDIDTLHADKLYYRILRLHQLVKETLQMEGKGNVYEDMW